MAFVLFGNQIRIDKSPETLAHWGNTPRVCQVCGRGGEEGRRKGGEERRRRGNGKVRRRGGGEEGWRGGGVLFIILGAE